MPSKGKGTTKRGRSDCKIEASEWTLPCEWLKCQQVFKAMDEFLRHMSCHLSQGEGSQADYLTQKEEGYSCLWRECGTQVQGEEYDFFRHTYFHCFHVKIKCIGSLLSSRLNVRACLLDNHTRNLIPELPERLQCGWHMCEVILDNPEIFYRHVHNHAEKYFCPKVSKGKNSVSSGAAAKCEWEGCDFVCTSHWRLKEHLRSHTQEKVIACPTCGGLFAARGKYLDHLKRQPDTTVQCYQCSHCNKRYSTERLLRDHVRHHVNQYKCPCCEMTCPTPSGLKSHLRYRHTNDKPYRCDHCNHTCKTASDIRKHMESHTMEAPYRCHVPSCDYESRSYSSLTNHFKRIHEDVNVQKYACHMCKSVFTRGAKLTVHLKKRHKFRWPSGHSRFRYKLHDDGFWRLQTVRYESIQLTEQGDENSNSSADVKRPLTSIDEPSAETDSSEPNEMEIETSATRNDQEQMDESPVAIVTASGDAALCTEQLSSKESRITSHVSEDIDLRNSESGDEFVAMVTDNEEGVKYVGDLTSSGAELSIKPLQPLSDTENAVNILSDNGGVDKGQVATTSFHTYNLEMLGYVALLAPSQTNIQDESSRTTHGNRDVENSPSRTTHGDREVVYSPRKGGRYMTLRSEDL